MSDIRTSDGKSMKVTDRRMFTPDGELREEYRHLANRPDESAAGESTPGESTPERPADAAAAPSEAALPPPEPPPPPEPGEPTFSDLVTLLAEHASIYLRQATVPSAEQAQNLELARLHIDLLSVLETKTAGHLDAEEQALLDDVIYRLKLGYANVQGF